MKDYVERSVGTKGRDENTVSMIIFPCNEEDLLEEFEVESVKELCFVDRPESKMSVAQFNYIMNEAEERASKLEKQIDASVRFLELRMMNHDGWKGTSDSIPLTFEDSIVWNWCMRDDYQHPDEKVKVWYHKGELTVFYGEKNESKEKK